MKFRGDNFFQIVRSYLTVYLPTQRCFSPHTVKSYKATLNILLDYLQQEKGLRLNQITFDVFSAELIRAFIEWLREKRDCGVSSQNQRLAVLKSFFKYAGIMEAACIAVQIDVSQIPLKKKNAKLVEFMSENALQGVKKGSRLLFCARAPRFALIL